MIDSKLKKSDDKTDLIAIGSKSQINQVTPILTPVSISGYDIPFSQSVSNLSVFVDETISMMCMLNACVVFFSVSYAD